MRPSVPTAVPRKSRIRAGRRLPFDETGAGRTGDHAVPLSCVNHIRDETVLLSQQRPSGAGHEDGAGLERRQRGPGIADESVDRLLVAALEDGASDDD